MYNVLQSTSSQLACYFSWLELCTGIPYHRGQGSLTPASLFFRLSFCNCISGIHVRRFSLHISSFWASIKFIDSSFQTVPVKIIQFKQWYLLYTMWRTFALLTIYLFFRCSLYFWKSHNPFSHTQISIIFLIKNSKHWNKKLTMITFTFLITSILNKTKNSVIILLREETVIWLEIQESFFRNPR